MKGLSQEISADPSVNCANPRRAAFTLTELLVVIAIVAVLFSLALPGLAGAGGRSRVAQCGSNLKQFTMTLELYGMDNNSKLPPNDPGAISWPWDLSGTILTKLTNYGTTRNMVYCPANPDQNALWFPPVGTTHTIGYAMTLPVTSALLSSNLNLSVIPRAIQSGTILIPPPQSSKRVLVADNIISAPGQTNAALTASYQWTGLVGGVFLNGKQFPFRTSHLNGNLPSGGNLGMLDGHVEWRKFKGMISRKDPSDTNPTELTWWW